MTALGLVGLGAKRVLAGEHELEHGHLGGESLESMNLKTITLNTALIR
jgi:hypothetical protein